MDLDGLEPSISCVLPPFSVPHVGSPFVALLTSAGGKEKDKGSYKRQLHTVLYCAIIVYYTIINCYTTTIKNCTILS